MRRPRRTAISAATTTTSRGSAPTRPRRSALPRAWPLRRLRPPDEQTGGRALADLALVAVQPDGELARRRLRVADLDLRAGNEPVVIEPVQQLAVMLGEPDDRRPVAGSERRERGQLEVLARLELGVDRPAVRAARRVPQLLVDPLDHVVAEGVTELVGVHVGLGGGIAHEVREQPLDDPVLADDLLRALAPLRGQERLLVLPARDEPVGLEPLQHLAGGGPRDP